MGIPKIEVAPEEKGNVTITTQPEPATRHFKIYGINEHGEKVSEIVELAGDSGVVTTKHRYKELRAEGDWLLY